MAHNEQCNALAYKKLKSCHVNMGIRVDTRPMSISENSVMSKSIEPSQKSVENKSVENKSVENKSVETQTEVTSIWECPICMEDTDERSILYSAHIFCRKCTSKLMKHESRCPICRKFLIFKINLRN